jgi:hypothetical protein
MFSILLQDEFVRNDDYSLNLNIVPIRTIDISLVTYENQIKSGVICDSKSIYENNSDIYNTTIPYLNRIR